VCLKYCLSCISNGQRQLDTEGPYASTLENSCEGWMTKLSALAVHEMRCCILGSSSMLLHCLATIAEALRGGKRTSTACG
jgi:hypothetical protein